jgi:hypothetical protein
MSDEIEILPPERRREPILTPEASSAFAGVVGAVGGLAAVALVLGAVITAAALMVVLLLSIGIVARVVRGRSRGGSR